MKRITLLLAISLVALFSCNKEKELTPVPEKPVEEGTTVFSASVEDPATKTSINGKKVNWVAGDEIAIFGEGTNATGTAASSGAESDFPVTGKVGAAPYLAVYPAVRGAYASETLKVSVPAAQTGAFADANIMVAKSSDENLAFKHLCGLLKFTVGAGVTAVKIKADNNVVIAGTAPVSFDGSGIPETGDVENGANEITVAINGAGEYYAALLPGVTLGGFYFEITTAGGSKLVFSPKNLKINRKSVMDMGNIDEHVVTDWFVTPAGAGKKNGVSWENAFGLAEFQAFFHGGAIPAETIAVYGNGTFHFMEGTYDTFSTIITFDFTNAEKVTDITLLGGYASTSTGTDLSKRNVASYPTVFDGTSASLQHLIRMDRYAKARIDGFTFRKFTSTSSDTNSGGGSVCYSFTGAAADFPVFTFANCSFLNNGSPVRAGAILVRKGTGTLENCVFSGNTATTNGPAVCIVDASSQVTVTGASTSVTGNTATNNGGAFYLAGASKLTIEDGTFSGNKAGGYGGLVGVGSTGQVTINGGTFSSNTSTEYGAVVGCGGKGTVTIHGGSFTDNTATTYGGVLYGNNGSNFTIEGTAGNRILMKDNVANMARFYSVGGAIYIVGNAETPSSLNVSYCDFEGNEALQQVEDGGAAGGAVGFMGTLSSVSFDNCSFTGNQAYRGGALQFDCKVTGGISLSNCVFDGNVALNPNKKNGGYGAAVFLSKNFTQTITADHCIFVNNRAVLGGPAWANYNNGMTCKVFLNGCKFSGNYVDATSNANNAIYICTGYVGMNNCAVWNNVHAGQDTIRPILLDGAASVVISNTTVYGHHFATYANQSNARLNLVNCLLAGSSYQTNTKGGVTYASGTGEDYVFQIGSSNSFYTNAWTTHSALSTSYTATWKARFDTYKVIDPYTLSDFTGFTPMTTTTEAYIRGLGTAGDTAFADWLGTVHGYDQDIDGNDRKSPYWPGCHQK